MSPLGVSYILKGNIRSIWHQTAKKVIHIETISISLQTVILLKCQLTASTDSWSVSGVLYQGSQEDLWNKKNSTSLFKIPFSPESKAPL